MIFLGTIESFADMNVDKFLAQSNPIFENISKSLNKNRQAALSQMHDKFQRLSMAF